MKARSHTGWVGRLALTIVLTAAFCATGAGSSIAGHEAEIAGLKAETEAQCVEHKINGMAVAVIVKGEIVMLETYGHIDTEKKKPVTQDTVFPIGSSTKPFTSILTAMLVSDGTMGWDDPVTDYLPYFDLRIDSDSDENRVTIRDLLSHRTGFFHMELVQKVINWSEDPDFASRDPSERFTRESLLRAAAEFEPKDPFRSKHNYHNIGMLAAGMATGKAAGLDWDSLMKKRMFEPLGMDHSTTSISNIDPGHEVAAGHLLEDDVFRPTMLIELDVIAPAGGINSSINDMAAWMLFVMNGGVHEGRRLVAEKDLRETWKKHIDNVEIGIPGSSYGLGWFITEWKGRTVVTHGGNSLGYSANLGFIPAEEVGYVMLSSSLPNPLQSSMGEIVWRALVSE